MQLQLQLLCKGSMGGCSATFVFQTGVNGEYKIVGENNES